MAEQLQKLRPDRDLQCYFERPSAAAALSGASANGFTVSGSWRQQFDWAVVEWNRDNVFEHPLLRCLPDGDLSGVMLSYEETRDNCIPMDSTLFPTVDWPTLRVWTDSGGNETMYQVPLKNYATAVAGSYVAPTVQFTLGGTVTAGDYVELAWLDQHFNYLTIAGDTPATAAEALAAVITGSQSTGEVSATASGAQITLTYQGMPGTNGNRVGVYGMVYGAKTESWTPAAGLFSGAASPTRWRIDLDFGSLHDGNGTLVPTQNVRKMRWTWAADLQPGDFARSEFSVAVTNWSVSGSNLRYKVPGPGSRRIEDDALNAVYTGAWTEARGNYSGGSIRWTSSPGAAVQCTYTANQTHTLLLGTRLAASGSQITVQVDGGAAQAFPLQLGGEDVLVRIPVGQFAGGAAHTVTVTHSGSSGAYFYFDFLEIAYPTYDLPDFPAIGSTTLATDWDTDHSLALAPERTAWLIAKLGFLGRANHYAGALCFYELVRTGHQYAAGTITFAGAPEFGKTSTVYLGGTAISHLSLIGETAQTTAKCFELLINAGATGVWAHSQGAVLTIRARTMGTAGSGLALTADTNSTVFTAETSGTTAGGVDGTWHTDLTATPRLNRAARDWTAKYLAALAGYGIESTVAFSTELQHGDESPGAGIAQRYSDGAPVMLNTPALQTNFGTESLGFWQRVYRDMADVMSAAGVRPYLQYGEVQWWYFANGSSLPFYDAYTKNAFVAQYGRQIATIANQQADPAAYPDECVLLPKLIGEFTSAITAFVKQTHADAQFEVLYPPDVNDTPLNRAVNFPTNYWTPALLDCLKTENFTFTGDRNLDKAADAIRLPMQLGFGRAQSAHLVGIGEYTTPWNKERRLATGERLESVVLFALDQFCLIGYGLPMDRGARRSAHMGS